MQAENFDRSGLGPDPRMRLRDGTRVARNMRSSSLATTACARCCATSSTARYDLLVTGAENRAIGAQLFVGHGVEALVEEASCSVALVLPKL